MDFEHREKKKKKKKKKEKKVGYRGGEKRGHNISCNCPQSTVRYMPARIQNKTENAKRESVKNDAIRHSSTIAVVEEEGDDALHALAPIDLD